MRLRLLSADFFLKNDLFFQEYHHSQLVWIQIKPNILLGLIWVQTVCKGYHQKTLAGCTRRT